MDDEAACELVICLNCQMSNAGIVERSLRFFASLGGGVEGALYVRTYIIETAGNECGVAVGVQVAQLIVRTFKHSSYRLFFYCLARPFCGLLSFGTQRAFNVF